MVRYNGKLIGRHLREKDLRIGDGLRHNHLRQRRGRCY